MSQPVIDEARTNHMPSWMLCLVDVVALAIVVAMLYAITATPL